MVVSDNEMRFVRINALDPIDCSHKINEEFPKMDMASKTLRCVVWVCTNIAVVRFHIEMIYTRFKDRVSANQASAFSSQSSQDHCLVPRMFA